MKNLIWYMKYSMKNMMSKMGTNSCMLNWHV